MLLVWQIAWRYLRGKRANIVPVLSRISMVAIAVGSCAMIVLFSIFNGFEHLIKDLYKAFYPELKVTVEKGKFFSLDSATLDQLHAVKGIAYITRVLEDNVLVSANDEQQVATIKGVDHQFLRVNDISPYVAEGTDSVVNSPVPTTILGMQMANRLGIQLNNPFSGLMVYYPNSEVDNIALNPQSAFRSLQLKPQGVFRIQDEFDSKYLLAPLANVQYLLNEPGLYSSLEIKLDNNATPRSVKSSVEKILGGRFKVATRFEQNSTLYMVMSAEKWAVYGILLLVLLIASFNMVGALTMLVLEKQRDITILKAMGASNRNIRGIFALEGVLWALSGGVAGLMAGALFCIGQQKFQWIRLEGAFIIDAYPVVMKATDFVWVILTVMIVGLLASWYPAVRSVRVEDVTLKTS